MSKVLQVRLTEDLKNNADNVFAQMGMDVATGVRLFLTRVVATREMPFKITAYSDEVMTPELEKLVEEGANDPEEFGPFDSAKEALAFLHKHGKK